MCVCVCVCVWSGGGGGVKTDGHALFECLAGKRYGNHALRGVIGHVRNAQLLQPIMY